MWVTSLGLAGEAGIFASLPFYPMFSGVPNGLLRLSPPQVHAAVHNSGATQYEDNPEITQPTLAFHGRLDEVVDPETVLEFSWGKPNVTLELLDSDHQLLDILDMIWERVAVFYQQLEPLPG